MKLCKTRLAALLLAMMMLLGLAACDGADAPPGMTGQDAQQTVSSGNPGNLPDDNSGDIPDDNPADYFEDEGYTSGEHPATTQDYEIILPSGETVGYWNGQDPWVEVNNNQPYFSESDKTRTDAFEIYSELDYLGRCGVAYANICIELMPTEARGEIGSVKPSGWHTVRYNDLIAGNYLYNRCHLIGFQLAGENANPMNLITGTRYLNIDGMLDFENSIDDYVEDTGNHVLYRVTPVFHEENLVCDGLLMEAWSVEDNGAGIRFCVFAYNNQPGIVID